MHDCTGVWWPTKSMMSFGLSLLWYGYGMGNNPWRSPLVTIYAHLYLVLLLICDDIIAAGTTTMSCIMCNLIHLCGSVAVT